MGVSIYYEARRERPLSDAERTAIDEIVRLNDVVPRFNEAGQWLEDNWEGFCIYERNEHTEPGVMFEGATRLPLTTEDEFWAAIQHWCRVLTLIRRALADAKWSVHVDDADIAWNEQRNEYDPSAEAGNA